ncbi:hypothetical protein DVB73_20645 [Pseudomonas plecoglossicida]|uniref:Uncharacterized protein n=1 Tax=Pseudomonas plecoglossicida TaxID=70775 RepID=A0AAD0R191_PSEDL|nr:hypothetical protein DVB73_20645 [Pseudomonas plecoglossicida]EPB96059.1 hypothetical protein L321_10224 [Pseudomonas plecoglossicida NB2011]
MPAVPTTALLYRLNQSVMALGSAVEEIRLSFERNGDTETSERLLNYLRVIESNGHTIADLMSEVVDRLTVGEDVPPAD